MILIFTLFLQFIKRNPNAPVGEGNWFVKELIKKHLHNRRDYIKRKINNKDKKGKKKENEKENEKEKEKEKENENENENESEKENENENIELFERK
jgi:hypothetical protein